ncbi:choline O-acetyltransferase-like [Babylonia areolata]|uniref:choline O-acetyltransferase-like n=1 Tax=Babylonia areolata TaxID=304850 RepID=UPI003FD16EF9
MDKYLDLLSTVVSEQQLASTRRHVQEFSVQGGWGEKLQGHLLERQEQMDNWAYDWWLGDMYMKIRLPLPINSNPGMVFPRQRFAGVQQQLSYAVKFIFGILDYKTMIDSASIPVERCRGMEKGQPLCMEQHYRMMSSYRRPGVPEDVQLTTLGANRPPYIIVACRDQFYKLDLEHDGAKLSESELYSQLSRVAAAAESDSVGAPSVGVLTSNHRSRWAEARARLAKEMINADNLDVIENSLFILCLDKAAVPTPMMAEGGEDGLVDVAHQMLHGQGTVSNTRNRWFDKTIQFVVSEDGACGMNYEHSVAEGIALVQLVEHALSFVSRHESRLSNQQETRQLPEPRRLRWTMTSETLSDLKHASEHIDTLIDDFDLHCLNFEEYGRDFAKREGVSPDAYIQLALQMTYYKLHRGMAMTYESASIRRYRQGRVDVIRANSPAALAWIRATLGQVEATTVLGHGIDCHLLGLREAARELGVLDTVPLFSDPSFTTINYFKLSTSQVPTTRRDSFMCYGPVVPDGYGACYNPFPDFICFYISSFRECMDTDSQMFALSLESTLLQMRELCLQGKQQLPPPLKPQPGTKTNHKGLSQENTGDE